MTRHNEPPSNDDEVEQLVAYLDGELNETEAAQVEARLNVDADVRRETEALQKAWDLLDHLPRAEPSPEFTHRTIENVELQANTARMQRRRQFWDRWWPRVVGLARVAGLLLAFLVGYLAYSHVRTREPADIDLARELRLIENKRLYELVGSVEFLRELDTTELFGEEGRTP